MAIRTSGSRIRLTKRALIMAGVEASYNVDPVLNPATDAVLAAAPAYAVKPTVLTRNFVRPDLSPLGTRIGRKVATLDFEVEIRGNGLAQTSRANACMFGRLLRGCGYAETSYTGAATVDKVTPNAGNVSANPVWAAGGAQTLRNRSSYFLTVVKGGASGTAKFRVSQGRPCLITDASVVGEGVSAVVTGTAPTTTAAINQTDPLSVTETIGGTFNVGDVITTTVLGVPFVYTVKTADATLAGVATAIAALLDISPLIAATAAGAVITITYTSYAGGVIATSGSPVTLGSSGCTVAPTFSGNLTLGDQWAIDTYPPGLRYDPISTAFESLTLYAYFDGLQHVMTGAFGTFSATAAAGSYGTAKFTFTGQFYAPTDTVLPLNAVFETPNPPVVQLAQLTLDDFQPVVNQFTFDQSNTVSERADVSSPDGFDGVRITDRDPKGGIDPEATLGADYDFWQKFTNSTYIALTMAIGKDVGNTILINAPNVQYTGLTYNDRSGLRTYDAALSFNRLVGNDEICFRIV